MSQVRGYGRITEASRRFSLPEWWVESVVAEYCDCRRFAEEGKLWIFDFEKVTETEVEAIPSRNVVISDYFLVQNVRPKDLSLRAMFSLVGLPVVPIGDADLAPEGPLNSTAFPFPFRNTISAWDPKLQFNTRAIVHDSGIFYQWTVAETEQLPGKNYHWFKSNLFDSTELFEVNERLQALRDSEGIRHPNPGFVIEVARQYEMLEVARRPIRERILSFHNSEKLKYQGIATQVQQPPLLSIFDSIRLAKNGYDVKTHMEPLFLRSAIRNLNKAGVARRTLEQDPDNETALLDEIECSAMCMISAAGCLESYINYVIATYLQDDWQVFKRASPRQKWLWVPTALNLPHRFKTDEPPFSDFSNLIRWRNNAIHHVAEYRKANGPISYTFSRFNFDNAKVAVETVRAMVKNLSKDSSIPLPQWLSTGMGSAELWDEVRSYLQQ